MSFDYQIPFPTNTTPMDPGGDMKKFAEKVDATYAKYLTPEEPQVIDKAQLDPFWHAATAAQCVLTRVGQLVLFTFSATMQKNYAAANTVPLLPAGVMEAKYRPRDTFHFAIIHSVVWYQDTQGPGTNKGVGPFNTLLATASPDGSIGTFAAASARTGTHQIGGPGVPAPGPVFSRTAWMADDSQYDKGRTS